MVKHTKQVVESLDRWRFGLERRRMKGGRIQTEYMCVNEMEMDGKVKLQGVEIVSIGEFKYLESIQDNGPRTREVKKRVQAGWSGWR